METKGEKTRRRRGSKVVTPLGVTKPLKISGGVVI